MKSDATDGKLESGRERRVHLRIQEKNSMAIKVLASPGAPSLVDKVFFCTSRDLSEGGAGFHIHTAMPVGADLELRMAVQDPTSAFKHAARVVWTKAIAAEQPYAVGVQFADTPAGSLSAWKDLVHARLARGAVLA